MQEFENPRKFTHFKIHTQYSICEGALKIDDLNRFSYRRISCCIPAHERGHNPNKAGLSEVYASKRRSV